MLSTVSSLFDIFIPTTKETTKLIKSKFLGIWILLKTLLLF